VSEKGAIIVKGHSIQNGWGHKVGRSGVESSWSSSCSIARLKRLIVAEQVRSMGGGSDKLEKESRAAREPTRRGVD